MHSSQEIRRTSCHIFWASFYATYTSCAALSAHLACHACIRSAGLRKRIMLCATPDDVVSLLLPISLVLAVLSIEVTDNLRPKSPLDIITTVLCACVLLRSYMQVLSFLDLRSCVPEWDPKNEPQFRHETDNTHCWCCSFPYQILNQNMGPPGGTFSRGCHVGSGTRTAAVDSH